MLSAISTFMSRLSPTWQALLAISGAGACGTVLGAGAVGFTQLPERVAALEISVEEQVTALEISIEEHKALPAHDEVLRRIEEGDAALMARLNRLICLQTLPDSVSHVRALEVCP